MIAALGYEWRRITSTRSMWILSGLLVALGLAYLLVIVGGTGVGADSVLTSPASLGGFLTAALGAQAIGQEYRFGTIRSTLTLFPRRPQIFAAKAAVAVGVAVAAGLLAVAVCVLIGIAS